MANIFNQHNAPFDLNIAALELLTGERKIGCMLRLCRPPICQIIGIPDLIFIDFNLLAPDYRVCGDGIIKISSAQRRPGITACTARIG
jgi:hypothetical protein